MTVAITPFCWSQQNGHVGKIELSPAISEIACKIFLPLLPVFWILGTLNPSASFPRKE